MIKIVADSTCDLSPSIIKEMDITLTPLYVIAGSETFKDGVDIKPSDVFKYVEGENKSCKTAAVNIYDYQRVFEEYSPKYDAVIQICISSGFSACYQNAVIAAEAFPNVFVVNSYNLSSGSGYIVYDAALMAKEGIAADEICRRLENDVPYIDTSFVIDRLDYLHKGGRCSGLEAIGAKLFSIKPCVEVVDGKMKIGKKYRGKFDVCLEQYVKDRLFEKSNIDTKRIFITHPMCSPETVSKVRDAINSYLKFDEIIETNAGCTVSNHCGPNTLGIIFKRTVEKH